MLRVTVSVVNIMKHFYYTEIVAQEVGSPAKGVKVRWLIDDKTSAPNFAMRMFTVEPNGYTPKHTHNWEHEVYILGGSGMVFSNGQEELVRPGDVIFVSPNEEHQFKNTGDEEFKFLCLIPIQK